jgi:hypothetical protein
MFCQVRSIEKGSKMYAPGRGYSKQEILELLVSSKRTIRPIIGFESLPTKANILASSCGESRLFRPRLTVGRRLFAIEFDLSANAPLFHRYRQYVSKQSKIETNGIVFRGR